MTATIWRARPGANWLSHPILAARPGGAAVLGIAEHLGVDANRAGVLEGAACASPGIGRDVMFPDKGDRRGAELARRVCALCPVDKAECLARFGDLPHGVVAGLTVRERRGQRTTGAGR
jgi:hypothetical protein